MPASQQKKGVQLKPGRGESDARDARVRAAGRGCSGDKRAENGPTSGGATPVQHLPCTCHINASKTNLSRRIANKKLACCKIPHGFSVTLEAHCQRGPLPVFQKGRFGFRYAKQLITQFFVLNDVDQIDNCQRALRVTHDPAHQ